MYLVIVLQTPVRPATRGVSAVTPFFIIAGIDTAKNLGSSQKSRGWRKRRRKKSMQVLKLIKHQTTTKGQMHALGQKYLNSPFMPTV